MLKKIQLPLSIVLLVVMIFVWKNILDRYFPGLFVGARSAPVEITALKVKGEVTMDIGDKTLRVTQGQIFDKPVSITTAANSVLILGYGEDFASKIKIGPDSKVDLSKYKLEGLYSAPGLALNLNTGRLLLKIFNPSKKKIIKVKTPNLSMGIRGTTFIVESFDNSSLLLVKEGVVEVDSKDGNPKFAKAGNGFLANGDDVKPIQLQNYNMDWNTESTTSSVKPIQPTTDTKKLPPTPVMDLTNINVPLTLEAELKKLQNRVEDLQASFPTKQQALKDQDKKLEDELDMIAQDQKCLESLMKGCEFVSESFKNDPANLKNNPSHLALNDRSKTTLENDMNKAKENIQLKINNLKAQDDVLQNDLQVEKDKLKNATAKIEQYKTADPTTQKSLLKEISEILDSSILRAISNK